MVFRYIESPEKQIPIFEIGVPMLQCGGGAMFAHSRPNLEGNSRIAFLRATGIKEKDLVNAI